MTHAEHVAQLATITWESTNPYMLVANYITALYENGHIAAGDYEKMIGRIWKK